MFNKDSVGTKVINQKNGVGEIVSCDSEGMIVKFLNSPNKFWNFSYKGIMFGFENEPSKAIVPLDQGCPHSELIQQYAIDCKTHRYPWELWECRSLVAPSKEWSTMQQHPQWNSTVEYRKKVETIDINGIKVPKPLKKLPKDECILFYPSFKNCFMDENIMDTYHYPHINSLINDNLLKKGLLHLTKESAKVHAEAFLSFTKEYE